MRGLPVGHGVVDQHRLGHLLPDAHGGVQRRHRLLEHHRDVPPAHAGQGRVAGADHLEVRARQPHRTGRHEVLGQQPHQRQPGQRLSRPGLADQSDPFPPADGERHVGHEVGVVDTDAQVADVDDRVLRRLEWQGAHRRSVQARVEVVAQAVAEQVEPEHGDGDRDAGDDAQPRRDEQQLLGLLQHPAPRRGRRRGAETEERQGRLGEHGDGERHGRLHDDQGPDVRQHVLQADGERAPSGRAGGQDVLGVHHLQRTRPHQPHEARHGGDPDRDHGHERRRRRRSR